jgi:hypothetical protein
VEKLAEGWFDMTKVKKMAFGGMANKVAAAAKALPKVAPAIHKQIVGGNNTAKPKTFNDALNASNLARATQSNQMSKPGPIGSMPKSAPAGGMFSGGAGTKPAGGPMGSVGPRPAGGMSDAAKTYAAAAAAKSAMNSTNSGTPQSGTGPRPAGGMSDAAKTYAAYAAAKSAGLGMKSGGAVGSASKRADGIATKGKTKGRMC